MNHEQVRGEAVSISVLEYNKDDEGKKDAEMGKPPNHPGEPEVDKAILHCGPKVKGIPEIKKPWMESDDPFPVDYYQFREEQLDHHCHWVFLCQKTHL